MLAIQSLLAMTPPAHVAPKTAGAPAPKAPPAAPQGAVWTGRANGGDIRWSKDDITVRAHGAQTFSARAFMAKALNVSDFEPGSYLEANARVKSVVGGIMSLEYTSYYNALHSAHPGGETRYVAINLAKPAQPVKLTDMFPEADVLKALLADPQVKAMLKQAGVKQAPKTLDALFQAIGFGTVPTRDHIYSFSADVLSQFAIHHVEGNSAYVRLGMPSASGADRYAFGQLGLKLPIPAALRPAFAEAQRTGAVAQSLDRIPASKNLAVTYLNAQP